MIRHLKMNRNKVIKVEQLIRKTQWNKKGEERFLQKEREEIRKVRQVTSKEKDKIKKFPGGYEKTGKEVERKKTQK
jgi:hypothetical protein